MTDEVKKRTPLFDDAELRLVVAWAALAIAVVATAAVLGLAWRIFAATSGLGG